MAIGGEKGATGAALPYPGAPSGRRDEQDEGDVVRAPGGLAALLRAVREDPRWLFTLVLAALVLAAIFAPLVAPYSPLLYHPGAIAQPPSLAHPFGTDDLGRDQLSRVIYGTRISLTVGILSIGLGVAVGGLLGVVGGFLGGWVD
jgi:peptide/nickel transport system permease protein